MQIRESHVSDHWQVHHFSQHESTYHLQWYKFTSCCRLLCNILCATDVPGSRQGKQLGGTTQVQQ